MEKIKSNIASLLKEKLGGDLDAEILEALED